MSLFNHYIKKNWNSVLLAVRYPFNSKVMCLDGYKNKTFKCQTYKDGGDLPILSGDFLLAMSSDQIVNTVDTLRSEEGRRSLVALIPVDDKPPSFYQYIYSPHTVNIDGAYMFFIASI